jgi:hypothetical protein
MQSPMKQHPHHITEKITRPKLSKDKTAITINMIFSNLAIFSEIK